MPISFWVFNNVPIEYTRPDIRRYVPYDLVLSRSCFYTDVQMLIYHTNVWSHSADAGTSFSSGTCLVGVLMDAVESSSG